MAEPKETQANRPGTYAGIQQELHNARQRVEKLAYDREMTRQGEGLEDPLKPENTLAWHEVQHALGPHISPRFEDREKIIAAAHALARERINQAGKSVDARTKAIQTGLSTALQRAIEHNALYRVPAIGKPGWRIRRRLQEFIYRACGKRGERLEMVGRGENKIGYLESQEELVRRNREAGEPFAMTVEKYGYPTDLVVRNRNLTLRKGRKREPTTWLIEVEPGGLKDLPRKIDILHRALDRRFYVSAASSARQARKVKTQLPEEARKLAIVFYTGTHPTLNQATQFFDDYQRENDIPDLAKHFKRREQRIYQQYHDQVLAGHDQAKLVEQQLSEILTRTSGHATIQQSQYPVYWLVPIGDALFRIDLKKAVRLYLKNPEKMLHQPAYVPTPKRKPVGIRLHQNLTLPDLDALRRLGAMKYVATLRPAILQ